MGYKVFDFECQDKMCRSSYQAVEIMVVDNEIPSCPDCLSSMVKVATCTRAKGRISTYNPFKAGGRKAHKVRNPFKRIDSNYD